MKIFIDPGHGGRDPGAVGNGMRESDINLEVALHLVEILRVGGVQVQLSRETDVSPAQRWQVANAFGADLLVSIHTNAGGGTGVETLIPTASPNNPTRNLHLTRRIAERVSNDIGTRFGMGVRRANGVMLETETRHGSIGVLRNSTMPAVLVEVAFIDSPPQNPDLDVLRNKRRQVAESIAGSIFEMAHEFEYAPEMMEDNMTDEKFNELIERWIAGRAQMPTNDHLAPDEFAAAVERGIMDGTRPQAFVTRQEVAVMAGRVNARVDTLAAAVGVRM